MEAASLREQGRELSQPEWQPYFEAINRRLEDGLALEATIEIAGATVDGTEAERLPLDGITYEDGDDEVAIGVGGRGRRFPAVLWHFVDHPARVWVREDEGVPAAIGVEAEDGTYTFVRLRPAPAS
jgi:hypothetical protein